MRRFLMVVFILFFGFYNVSFASEFFPLSSVHRGQKGYVKTVIYGDKISSFKVEVLGILKRHNGSHLILIKAFPDLVAKTGGIAAGMSGSPLFINGKIVGAIGYGWRMADHSLGLVTPIKEMLDVWKWYKPKKHHKRIEKIRLKQVFRYGGKDYREIWISSRDLSHPEDVVLMRPVVTPLVVSGLSSRAKRMISDILSGMGDFKLVDVPDDTGIRRGAKLEPGSAIGVELSKGDINIGAVGTLTYIDRKSNRMVGFGHPFLMRGDVDYFLTSAYVYQVVKSIDVPFKLGVPLKVVGSLVEDRKKAIGGIIGLFPHSIPVKVQVIDEDHNRRKEFGFRLVRDGEITPLFLSAAVMSCIDRGWGRIGEGTSSVRFSVMGYGLPFEIRRLNYFWSPKDIAKLSVQELKDVMILLLRNEYSPVSAESIKVVVNVTKSSRVMFLKELKTNKVGEKLDVYVLAKVFRGKGIVKKFTFRLPAEWRNVPLLVVARGGGIVGMVQKGEKKTVPKVNKSFKEELKDFLSQESNNQIIVEVFPMVGKLPKRVKNNLKKQISTNYYIEGYLQKSSGVTKGKR